MTPELVEVGRIGRAHGIRGGLYVALSSDRVERLDVDARLFDGRQWLVVDSSRLQPTGKWLVHFQGIDDRTTAESMSGKTLSAQPLDDPDAFWVHDLIGSSVAGTDGQVFGTCVGVLQNPAHDILELDNGFLVPIVFVLSSQGGVITIEPPDGLFDLD